MKTETLEVELAGICCSVGLDKSDLRGFEHTLRSLAAKEEKLPPSQRKGFLILSKQYSPTSINRLHSKVLQHWIAPPAPPKPAQHEPFEPTQNGYLITFEAPITPVSWAEYLTKSLQNALHSTFKTSAFKAISDTQVEFLVSHTANPFAMMEVIRNISGVKNVSFRSEFDYGSEIILTPELQW